MQPIKKAKVPIPPQWANITGKVKPTTKLASHKQKVEIPMPSPRKLWGKISDNKTQVVGETQDWKKAKKLIVEAITK